MYKDCSASYKLDGDTISVPHKTGVQQGDNASPILFAYIMQSFFRCAKNAYKSL